MTAAPEQQIGVEWAIENSSFPSSLQRPLAVPIHWIHVTNGALLIFSYLLPYLLMTAVVFQMHASDNC